MRSNTKIVNDPKWSDLKIILYIRRLLLTCVEVRFVSLIFDGRRRSSRTSNTGYVLEQGLETGIVCSRKKSLKRKSSPACS